MREEIAVALTDLASRSNPRFVGIVAAVTAASVNEETEVGAWSRFAPTPTDLLMLNGLKSLNLFQVLPPSPNATTNAVADCEAITG